MKTIAEERTLDFLSRKAVIPKYGFPVDVVELDVRSTNGRSTGVLFQYRTGVFVETISQIRPDGGWKSSNQWLISSRIVVLFQRMIPRHVTERILEGLADTPVVYIQGARQAGKSTIVRSIAERRWPASYLTLDSAAVLAAANHDAEGFIAGLERPAVIDEAQRVPALALAIKAAVDVDRRPGQFLLTGSASVLSLPKLAESLAGRMELHTLWPFSQGEMAGVRETFIDRMFAAAPTMAEPVMETEDALITRICAGGYPEIHARRSPARRQAWFDAYVDAILQRDVRDWANIERLADMPRLLALLASRVGQLINYAELARALAMPQSTLKRYMTLLGMTFLVQPLPPWFANIGKRLTKAPKLMLADTGLVTHLIDADAERLKRDRTLLGHVLENFVAMELTKQLGWSRRRCKLFHFRTDAGAEADFVLEDRKGRLVGVEVKCTQAVHKKDFRGLEVLAQLTGERFTRGVVLYPGATAVPFGRNLHALPMPQLWT